MQIQFDGDETDEVIPDDQQFAEKNAPFMYTNAIDAWKTTTGSSSVKVAIIDHKVEDHIDIRENLISCYDAVYGRPTDDNNENISSHGTHVASIIGAKGNNGLYSTGVCWDVSLVSVQVYSQMSPNIGEVNINALLTAFNYLKNNNIFIANCSFGWLLENKNSLKLDYFKKIIDDWGGILIVSAGNEGINIDENPRFLSCINSENIISVGAFNRIKTDLWIKSNYGINSVDILAPGFQIYLLEGTASFHEASGTSYAAPFVTGAAALLKSAHPEATSLEIIQALKLGCNDDEDWVKDVVKYGCLDIANSLTKLEEILEHRQTAEDGVYSFSTQNDSNRVITSKENNTNFEVNEYAFNDTQKFEIEYHIEDYIDDYYTIKNVDSGKYLEAIAYSDGIALEQNPKNNSDTQKWYIEVSSDNSYQIVNVDSGFAIDFGTLNPSNGQLITLQERSNTVAQKINFIYFGKTVVLPDGLYTISSKADTIKYVNNVNGNIELGSTPTIFRVKNSDGYCYITEFYGDKAIDLSNENYVDFTNVQASVENETINSQKWIIKSYGDGFVYISSFINQKVLSISTTDETNDVDYNISLQIPIGNDTQLFIFEELNRNSHFAQNSLLGQYCYAVDETETYGIDISNNALYNINTEKKLLALEKGLYGLYKIKDVDSGNFLQVQSDCSVAFALETDSENQLWEMEIISGIHYFKNVYTKKYLGYTELQSGEIQVFVFESYEDSIYNDIVFNNYTNIEEGIEYYILPKNDLKRVLTYDDTTSADTIALRTSVIDFEENGIHPDKQKFVFEFFDAENAYRIRSSYNEDLMISSDVDGTIFSETGSLFNVVQSEDGYYKFTYANKSLVYESRCEPSEKVFHMHDDLIEIDHSQKFMLIPVSDVITEATYQILIGDDETKALSVNGSMTNGTTITVETANINDISQRFYVDNFNGSYKLISLYSGKTVSLSDDFDSIVQAQISESDTLQKWQVINSIANGSDYSVKLVSYRIGDYLRYNNDALSTSYYSGENDQLFTLKRISSYENNFLGEIVSSVNSDKDIFLDNTKAILSSISINGRNTLRFVEDADGLWTIEDRISSTVLTCNNSGLIFAEDMQTNSQKWLITPLIDGSFTLVNLQTGSALSNNVGSLSIYNDLSSTNCKFIIHIIGDVDNDRKISTKDVLHIRKYLGNLIELSDEEFYRADYNEDDDVSTKDILALQRYLGGLTNTENQTLESSMYSLSRNLLHPTSKLESISNEDIIEMTDEEFLMWLFGDVDFDSLSVTIFG